MSDQLDTVQYRVWPHGQPKDHVAPIPTWPPCALVCATKNDPDGGVEFAWLLELFLGRVTAEAVAAADVVSAADLRTYVARHRGRVLAGCDDRIRVLPVDSAKLVDGDWNGLGYKIRDRCFRSGDAFVLSDIGAGVASISARWVPSRKHPDNFTFYLEGLVKPDGTPFRDSAGITVRRAGERFVASWTGGRWVAPKKNGTKSTPGGEPVRGRGMPKRGPIVDVLNVATALRGTSVDDLDDACRMFDVKVPVVTGNRIDDLRAEAHAIAVLYAAEVREARGMGLDLNLAFLVSTGGIATAIFRETGL